MSDAEHGGPWTERDHLDDYYCDEGLADEIAQLFTPQLRSVLDIGAGLGYYVRFLSRRMEGPCVGYEPLINISGENWLVVPENLLEEHEWVPGPFDLVICIEVAEHVPREKHTMLFDAIVSPRPQFVVFSGATPGQTGLGHVACRNEVDWMEEFRKRGYIHKLRLSSRLRKAAYWGWFQDNINVFKRGR